MITLFISCKEDKKSESSLTYTTVADFPKKNLNPIDRFGQLLVDVQMQRVFPDGKTFVDCEPRYPADTILKRYSEAKKSKDFDLRAFVLEHFKKPEVPTNSFKSDTSLSTSQHINTLWSYLKRDADSQEVGSRIALPEPYIVPGGRFQEVYYWDSYFILLGLKEAGETQLIQNILDNFAYQIKTIGFIPNGNRTYYKNRSQPPFFAEMVNLLASIQGDTITYNRYKNALEKEYAFWMKTNQKLENGKSSYRVVKLADGKILNRYWSNTSTPRAESYREDILTANEANERDPEDIYLNICAACESGWDFSSRWFADPNKLSTIQTTQIIPVDLNALLYNLELTLAKARKIAGENDHAEKVTQAAEARKDAINTYLWDSKTGSYKDYNLNDQSFSEHLSLAMVYPLYFELSSPEQATATAKILENEFLKPGGLVTTLYTNGQQWDSPNGWPPHQWLAIRGLEKYNQNALASTIKQRWLKLNEQVYRRTGKMLEKYNVIDTSLVAGGGEYPTQDGFGWTNGVYLELKNN